MRWAPFLDGYDLTNLTIGGENGTIDGSGAFFWALHDAKKMTSTRPPLWSCVRCTDMVLEDTTFLNAGFWTIHPVLGRRLTARRIYILAPNDAPNTGDTFLGPQYMYSCALCARSGCCSQADKTLPVFRFDQMVSTPTAPPMCCLRIRTCPTAMMRSRSKLAGTVPPRYRRTTSASATSHNGTEAAGFRSDQRCLEGFPTWMCRTCGSIAVIAHRYSPHSVCIVNEFVQNGN
jgi:hypothetical protein